MNHQNPFKSAQNTIKWAQSAVDELHKTTQEFVTTESVERIIEQDAKTGLYCDKIRLTDEFPPEISRKATEACTQTKHSLDQAMHACRLAFKQSTKGKDNLNFPWAQSPSDLETILDQRPIPPELHDIFRKHEPYFKGTEWNGGDNLFRQMAQVANQKHTINITPNIKVSGFSFSNLKGSGSPGLSILFPIWDSDKNEMVIATWKQGYVQPAQDYEFSFNLVLDSPKLSNPVDAIGSLRKFADKASRIIYDLEAVSTKHS